MEIDYFKYNDNFLKYKNIKSKVIIKGKIENPKITIAIPTYKRNHLIGEAINSAINQIKFDDYEIIIVDNDDDFNNMELEKILKEYKNEKISYYKNEKNIGMFGNWNRCIELAKGEYISILNDDDWLEKNFLLEVSKYINGKRAIYTNIITRDFRKQKYQLKESILKKYLKKIYFTLTKVKKIRELKLIDFFYGNKSAGTLGILFNKDALLRLGGYNEKFYPSSDYFLHAYYCNEYGVLMLKKNLGNYRVQENESMKEEVGNLWVSQGKMFREFLIKKYLKDKKYVTDSEIITENFKKNLEFWNIKVNYNKKMINNKKFMLRKYLRDIF